MTGERVLSDEQVATVLARASAEDAARTVSTAPHDGLTVTELKQIAAEVGIDEEAIDRAVRSLTRPAVPAASKGLAVARAVDLPGTFSDEDWNRLVFDLHEMVPEPGEVQVEGGRRHWRSKDYHILVEPAETGSRMRLRTQSEGPAAALMGGLLGGGLMFFLMGLFFMLLTALKGNFPDDLAKTLFVSAFAMVGLGCMAAGAYRLPRWRAEQERLFDEIALRALAASDRDGPRP